LGILLISSIHPLTGPDCLGKAISRGSSGHINAQLVPQEKEKDSGQRMASSMKKICKNEKKGSIR
jgi:hypothetical protein